VKSLPHDRSFLLCRGEKGGVPTDLFIESIDRWMGALVMDDRVSETGTGGSVESVAYAKEAGTVAGVLAIERLVDSYFPSCVLELKIREGYEVSVGEQILSINGPSSSVLSCERILLNVLGRMSGIATETADWVVNSGGIGIACTRKSSWGLLDKWAVHVGGGLTHRLSKKDAPMIKENDLAVITKETGETESSIRFALDSVDKKNASFTILEVTARSQAVYAARAWSEIQSDRKKSEPLVILLDNMGDEECGKTDSALRECDLRHWCILEGSGGIKRGSLDSWVSNSRVDVISTSEINLSARPLDISMMIGGL